MLTEQDIREGYQRKHDRPMSDDDYNAFVRFVHGFECTDAESFEEANEKILITFASLCESPHYEVKDRLDKFFSKR